MAGAKMHVSSAALSRKALSLSHYANVLIEFQR